MTRKLGVTLVAINIYAFALSFLWNTLHPLVVPYIISQQEPTFKNTFLGLITAAGLVVATIVQPLAGRLSDGFRSRWGRRRPFILVGTLFDLVFLAVIALAGNFWLLFAAWCLLQTSSNIAHGPYQGFIPDLVPDSRKGLASGVKNLLELIALVLGSQIIGSMVGDGRVSEALLLIGVIVFLAMVATMVLVREQPAVADDGARAVSPPPRADVMAYLRAGLRRLTSRSGAAAARAGLTRVAAAVSAHSSFAWYVLSRLLILAGLAAVRTFALNYIQDVLRVDRLSLVGKGMLLGETCIASKTEEALATCLTGNLMAVLGICVLLVVLPAGYLADRFGKKRLNVLSAVIGAAGTALMVGVSSYQDLVIYGAIVGVAVGVFMSANWALAMDLIPAGEAAFFLGLTNLATAGSGVLASALGPLIDAGNRSAPGQGYTVLFAAAAVMWLIGGLMMARLPVRR